MGPYAVGALFFALAWLLLFLAVPRVRRVMLASGLAFSPAGPISEYWHLRDYWSPEFWIPITLGDWRFGLEDLAVAGFLSGIGAGLYELFLPRSGDAPPLRIEWGPLWEGVWKGMAVVVAAMLLLTDLLQVNSLPATVIIMAGAGFLAGRDRARALLFAVPAGLLGALLMWVFYWGFYLRLYPGLIPQWWKAEALSGIFLAGVPLEEVLWGGVVFSVTGPIFRFLMLPQESLSAFPLPVPPSGVDKGERTG